MSTCRGCWGDELRGPEFVLVTTGENAMVGHPARSDCPIVDQPHRLTECGAFGEQLRPITPSHDLAPCPAVPGSWLGHARSVRAGYYSDGIGHGDHTVTRRAQWLR